MLTELHFVISLAAPTIGYQKDERWGNFLKEKKENELRTTRSGKADVEGVRLIPRFKHEAVYARYLPRIRDSFAKAAALNAFSQWLYSFLTEPFLVWSVFADPGVAADRSDLIGFRQSASSTVYDNHHWLPQLGFLSLPFPAHSITHAGAYTYEDNAQYRLQYEPAKSLPVKLAGSESDDLETNVAEPGLISKDTAFPIMRHSFLQAISDYLLRSIPLFETCAFVRHLLIDYLNGIPVTRRRQCRCPIAYTVR